MDLGILIDSSLRLDQQIEVIKARALARISPNFKIFRFLDLNRFKLVVNPMSYLC